MGFLVPVADLVSATNYMRDLESSESNIPYEYLSQRALASIGSKANGSGQVREDEEKEKGCVELVEVQNVRINNGKWQR